MCRGSFCRSLSSTFWIYLMLSKRRPLCWIFIFRNMVSVGALLGEYGGYGSATLLFLVRNSRVRSARCVVLLDQQFFLRGTDLVVFAECPSSDSLKPGSRTAVDGLVPEDELLRHNSSNVEKDLVKLRSCPALFRRGNELFRCEDCWFVSRSYPYIQVLSPVKTLGMKDAVFLLIFSQ